MRLLKIPRFVEFPGGYEITVSVLNDTAFNKENGDSDWASWDCEEQVIYLRKSRPPRKKLEDFVHEMGHAYLDWAVWVLK